MFAISPMLRRNLFPASVKATNTADVFGRVHLGKSALKSGMQLAGALTVNSVGKSVKVLLGRVTACTWQRSLVSSQCRWTSLFDFRGPAEHCQRNHFYGLNRTCTGRARAHSAQGGNCLCPARLVAWRFLSGQLRNFYCSTCRLNRVNLRCQLSVALLRELAWL